MVPHRSVIWMLILSLALTSCAIFNADVLTPSDQTQGTPVSVASSSVQTATPQPATTPTDAPDYVQQIRNAQYQLGLPDSLQIVQLTDGKFEQGTSGSADLVSVFVTDFLARGDLNGDNSKDIFLAGNFYGLKPQAGRFDASYGVTLVGTKEANVGSAEPAKFRYLTPTESGLFVNGEVRDIKKVGKYLVVALNNQPLRIFTR